MTNLLVAIKNIIQNSNNDLILQYKSLNRINSVGEALEFYVKDIFSCQLAEDNLNTKEEAYSRFFSYLGNQNNPPDIMIKSGDAVEVKKILGVRPNGLALNSSYPKDFLFSDSPMITSSCKECEEWTQKDLLYVIGNIVDEKIKSLWFIYGNCYAASREVYEKIKNTIAEGVNSLPDIEFGETNELGRVNKVDPLGITDLRIRGMWAIKHPIKVFYYIPEITAEAEFKVNAILLTSKYDSFPRNDREELEALTSGSFIIKDIKIKSPNNPAVFLDAKLISFNK